MENVIPQKGFSYTNNKSGLEVELTTVDGETVVWESIEKMISGTVYDGLINELFTFKPANDLEWLAYECSEWDDNYHYIARYGTEDVAWARTYSIGCYTRQQWQGKRNELFGVDMSKITCKEDLMNTHVDNVNGELKALFLNKCKEFNVDYFDNHLFDAKYVEAYSTGWMYTNQPEQGRKLTLAAFKAEVSQEEYDKGLRECVQKIAVLTGHKFGVDIGYEKLPSKVEGVIDGLIATIEQLTPAPIKPKMNVDYKLVEDSIFNLHIDFRQRELYFKHESGQWLTIKTTVDLAVYLDAGKCYRRVETEVTWQDEVEGLLGCAYDDAKISGMIRVKNPLLVKICRLVVSHVGMTDKPE